MPNRKPTQSRNSKSRRTKSQPVHTTNVWASAGTGTELKAMLSTGGNYQLYHNVAATFFNNSNLLNTIVQGTNYYERIGNRISLRRLDAIMVLNNKTDRPNVSYRVLFFAAPATTSTDTGVELLVGGGFTGIPAFQNAQCLHDSLFPQNQGSGMDNNITPNKERSFTHRVSVPLMHPVTYNTDGNCSTRIVGFVIPYDAYGTLTTDNIASVAQLSWRITFTDT